MYCHKARFRAIDCIPLKMLALAVAAAACLPINTMAQSPEIRQSATVSFDIPAENLSESLGHFSTQSGIQVMFRPELVAGKVSRGVFGVLEPAAALHKLLEGSGLKATQVNNKTYVLLWDSPAANVRKQRRTQSLSVGQDTIHGVDDLEKVVVVGSRLKVNPTDSVLPIRVITREEIDRSGAGAIAQVLSALPEVSISNNGNTSLGVAGGTLSQRFNEINATTVQMRGLPMGSTLVLINGRRTEASSALISGGLFDLSTIPLSLVDRIEILPSGSSAIYGGDGLAGVINLVLRTDVSGAEIRLRKDAAEGYGEDQASVLWGKTWERGSFMIQASWRATGGLTAAERSLTADQDFTRFGGVDRRASSFANPAVVYSLDGCDISVGFCGTPLNSRGNLPGLDAPVAVVPFGQNGVGLTPQDFVATSGQNGLSSLEYSIFSPERSESITVSGDIAIGNGVTAFGEMTYNRRELAANRLVLTVSGGVYGMTTSTIPAHNPFNPFGVPVGIDYSFSDTGYFREFSQEYVRALLGIRGAIFRNTWDWEVSAWRTVDRSHTGKVFGFMSHYLPPLYNSTDPATAFNAFVGDGSAPLSQEALESLAWPITDDFSSRVLGAHGFMRGPLMTLPAGELMAVFGAEHQQSDFGLMVSVYGEDFGGRDTSKAFFTEIRAPIIGDDSSTTVALTGAYRRESSNRYVNDANTGTIGIEYRPSRSMLLRATHSTAFKPPRLHSVSLPTRPTRYHVRDPRFDQNATIVVDALWGGGVSADLRPETSENTTLGVVYSPSDDLRISMSAWTTDIKDRISQAEAQFFIDHEDAFPGRVVRNLQTSAIELIDTREFNVLGNRASGMDISLEGRIRSGVGEFVPNLMATRVWEHKEKMTDLTNETNSLGVLRWTGWSPEWKVVPRLLFIRSNVVSSVAGRYVSSYDDPAVLTSGQDAGRLQSLGSFWMFDVNIDLHLSGLWKWGGRLGSRARLSIGANNVLNRLPDYCNFCGSGYDPGQYDIMGRRIYAELRVEI